MNRKTTIFLIVLTALLSCNKTESISKELNSLEQRIAALEDKVAEVNNNAVAAKEFLDTAVVISSFENLEYGYRMTLSNGKVVEVTYGREAPGIVPMIGVNSAGKWVMSIDGGKTFSVIEGSDDPTSGYGRTPQVKVDQDGYWIVSVDGGKTFSRILNAEGKPISAVDGREVAQKYAFFASVLVDREKNLVTFNLIDGSTAVVPLYCASEVNVPLFVQKGRIFRGETLKYDCTLKDIKKAYWHTVPKGWSASLEDSSISFTSSKDAEAGEYTFELATVNSNNLLKMHTFTFTLDTRIFFDDFDKGTMPDTNYWEPIPIKFQTGWSKYLTNTFENSYVRDGMLYLKSDKSGSTYKAAGIRTKSYFGRCRIEVRVRFSQVISSGVNHAIWLFPAPYSPAWPYGGEIDIVEHLNNQTKAYVTVHSNYTYNLGQDKDKQGTNFPIKLAEFNTYGIEITEEAVIFYLNGVQTHKYSNAHLADEDQKGQYPFYDSDFYLLLSPHLGTDWAGPIAGDELPTTMEIDWVKITEL